LKAINKITKLTSLAISTTLLIGYYLTVFTNILIGKQNMFTSRSLLGVALFTMVFFQLFLMALEFKNRAWKELIFETVITVTIVVLVLKFFNDYPIYYKHNNQTSFLFQVIMVVKLGWLCWHHKKNETLLIYLGFMLSLLVVQGVHLHNSNVQIFYQRGLWLYLSYAWILLHLFILNKPKFINSQLIVLIFNVLYFIASTILVYKSLYTVTHVKIVFEIAVLMLFLISLFQIDIENKKLLSINWFAPVIYFFSLVVLIQLSNHFRTYNMFLLIFSALLFTIIWLANLKKDLISFVWVGLELVILVLCILFMRNLNQLTFMSFMIGQHVFILVTYLKSSQLLKHDKQREI